MNEPRDFDKLGQMDEENEINEEIEYLEDELFQKQTDFGDQDTLDIEIEKIQEILRRKRTKLKMANNKKEDSFSHRRKLPAAPGGQSSQEEKK